MIPCTDIDLSFSFWLSASIYFGLESDIWYSELKKNCRIAITNQH